MPMMHQKLGSNLNVHYYGNSCGKYDYLLTFSVILETDIMKKQEETLVKKKKTHKYI